MLLRPSKLLAHPAGSLKPFHGFPDVGQTCGFCLWALEDPSDSYLEDSADEGAKKDTIAYDALEIQYRINILEVDAQGFQLANIFEPLDYREIQLG